MFLKFSNATLDIAMNSISNLFVQSELSIRGTVLFPGLAHGKIHLLKRIDLNRIILDKTLVDIISKEIARLDLAVSRSKEQIIKLLNNSRHIKNNQSYQIFEAELLLLNDSTFVKAITESVFKTSFKVESILAEEILKIQIKMSQCSDCLLLKGLTTTQDLYYRILYTMLPSDQDRIQALLNIPHGSILEVDRLTPIEVAMIPLDKTIGILIEEGTTHSHSSIMIKALGIPAIIDLQGIGSLLDENSTIQMDSYRGYVFINPKEETIKEYEKIALHNITKAKQSFESEEKTVIKSKDGYHIHLLCNASSYSEIQHACNLGITDIGLFRTEISYISSKTMLTIEQDIAFYSNLFGLEKIKELTIRLLDLGGDKLPFYLQMNKESDPQLGCRGIRFLLSHQEILKKQIRAILIAGKEHYIRILLPFVTTVDDLLNTRAIIRDEINGLSHFEHNISIGVMIEVPSIALSLDQFLPYVNFVCLGTNDLIQYFFAANRDQFELINYCKFTHPAFLKMLHGILTSCKKYNVRITACGEMASDPIGCCLLASLGFRYLSVHPGAVHIVRQSLSTLNINHLRDLLPSIFALNSADAVDKLLKTNW